MIISKTPLRISFFGGGTDIPSFYEKEAGCVISTTINKYVYLIAHPIFEGFNEKSILSYSIREIINDLDEIKNTRIKEVMKKVDIIKGIEIHSLAEVPAGTGLGSSSSFTVGLLNLLYAYRGKSLSNEEIAKIACDIEINKLNEPIGKQDQYATSIGGFNFIKFNEDGSVEIEKINATKETIKELNKKIIIFYLNKTREASNILQEQKNNILNNLNKFDMLKNMKKITLQMKDELNNNKIDNFGKMLHESWLLKKGLANNISDDYIDSIYERGLKAGAEGGKVLGAGGGGFILFYCEPEKHHLIKNELKELIEFKVEFINNGTKIIHDS